MTCLGCGRDVESCRFACEPRSVGVVTLATAPSLLNTPRAHRNGDTGSRSNPWGPNTRTRGLDWLACGPCDPRFLEAFMGFPYDWTEAI